MAQKLVAQTRPSRSGINVLKHHARVAVWWCSEVLQAQTVLIRPVPSLVFPDAYPVTDALVTLLGELGIVAVLFGNIHHGGFLDGKPSTPVARDVFLPAIYT